MRFLVLLSSVFLLASCKDTSAAKEKSVSVRKTRPAPEKRENADIAYSPNFQPVTVAVKAKGQYAIKSGVSGLIEEISVSWKPGMKFKKGDLLVQINNRETFSKLSAGKRQLAALAREVIPSIQHEENKAAWQNFGSGISATKLLPALPDTDDPGIVARKKELSNLYINLAEQEQQMAGYFIVAAEDGVILEQKAGPGNSVKQGQTVFIAARNGKKAIRLPENFTYKGPVMLIDQKTKKVHSFTIQAIVNGEAEVPSTVKPGSDYLLTTGITYSQPLQ